MKNAIWCVGLMCLVAGCDQPMGNQPVQPDNTGTNERDAEGATTTPFDQSNSQPDIDLVAEIRAEVLDLDDLSVNGRNVKIITEAGKVTLRGPVESRAESDAIERVASGIAGAENVVNELEVKTE